jgi:peptide/nickel transport system permease protein
VADVAVQASPATRRRHPLLVFVARRLAVGVLLLWLVSVLVFTATSVLPGDVAAAALGRQATPESLAALRADLELDRPLPAQYLDWLGGLVRGDLGESLTARQPVWDLIRNDVENTLVLTVVAVAVLLPLAGLLGVVAGARPGRGVDLGVSAAALGLVSVPEFVIGTVLVLLFGVAWGLLPPLSLVPPGTSPLADPVVLVLPVATLVLAGLGYMVRMVRAGVADAVGSRYVEMARLNGTPEPVVIVRHALRNALAPSVQAFALTLQWLIGGVVVVEILFAYPGVGATLVESVVSRDLTLVQSVAMLIAATYIVINIVADLLVVMLIPKLRTAVR